jgi:hypothetical protein
MDTTSALFLSVAAIFIASPEDGADKALLNAYLKQSGIESHFKRLEKKEVPDEARIYLGYAAFISKTMIDKKVVVQWKF